MPFTRRCKSTARQGKRVLRDESRSRESQVKIDVRVITERDDKVASIGWEVDSLDIEMAGERRTVPPLSESRHRVT
jgi:hypothetical protein